MRGYYISWPLLCKAGFFDGYIEIIINIWCGSDFVVLFSRSLEGLKVYFFEVAYGKIESIQGGA
jgi:hypothetical protein